MKLHKILGFLLVFAIGVLGCIREDVLLPPEVQPLSPSTITSGSIITLNGNYLGKSTLVFVNDSLVSVQGEPTMTQVQFIVPFSRTKRETFFFVTTEAGSSVSHPLTILPPAPSIKKVIPVRAPVNRIIKITGSYFEEAIVQFKSSSQNDWTDVTPSKVGDTLFAVVPPNLPRDAADIRIKSTSGESVPFSFTVLVPPTISGVFPGKAGMGTQVTLTGKDFDYVLRVRFGEFPAEIISNTIDQLLVRVPEGATTDSLFVETEGGTKRHIEKYIIIPAPKIENFDKKSGNVGMELNIVGVHLEDASEIRFGNIVAQITSKTTTSIKTTIPDGAQSGKISVIGPGGIDESDEDFIVEGAPLINVFEPSSGSTNTIITLNGLNLSKVTTAMLGVQELDILKDSQTDNELKVKVRNGSVTGKITVKGPGGSFETPKIFTIAGSARIDNVTPNSGVPGTIVTILGENFPDQPVVKFANEAIADVSSFTSTKIVCQVPSSAKTGLINIHGALSPTAFSVIVVPTISKIDPLKGAADKEIMITGANLKGATIRFHDNIVASKIVDEDGKIVVKVPASASSGKITATTSGGSVSSVENFEVINKPTITSFYPTTGVAGTPITISGTNLQHNPAIFFFNQINATIKSVSSTQILVDVPAGASTGPLSIKTDALNTGLPSSGIFTVVGKPTITSIQPASGTIKEKVTINGSNLKDVISISFDGKTTAQILNSSNTQIVLRIPSDVDGSSNRSINVHVKTASDVSGNYTYSLLGTPRITKVSPDNNPNDWAFLIEGVNLGSVKKISIGGKVPEFGSRGIDQQAYNYITTKVPKDVMSSPPNHKLALYYTSEDSAITRDYNVLSAPPPGVFPPPQIILPPPLPSNYVQTDLSDYWVDDNFEDPDNENALRCYQLRANFTGNPPFGIFCDVVRFYFGVPGQEEGGEYGSGNWNRGSVSISFGNGEDYTGQVFDQAASKLVLTDPNGRQLILVNDASKNCASLGGPTGPCQE